MVRKKKKEERGVSHDRWLVSYADFITLLFALFVVMFAASNADQDKAGQVAQAVQIAFSDLAIFSPAGKVFPLYDEGGLPSDDVSIIGNTQADLPMTNLMSLGSRGPGAGGRDEAIEEVRRFLDTLLADEVESGRVRLNVDARGLTVTLAEAGFFRPGSAVLEADSLPVVAAIAAKLAQFPYSIRVEGHTDNIPIRTAQFPSNWELSTSRATHVLQYLITESHIPPSRLSAVGYGEYRPVATNETREGRSLNRRVDLVILNRTSEGFEPRALAQKTLEETGAPLAFVERPPD